MNAILLIFTIIILNCFGGLHSDFLNLLSIYYKTVYVYIIRNTLIHNYEGTSKDFSF